MTMAMGENALTKYVKDHTSEKCNKELWNMHATH